MIRKLVNYFFFFSKYKCISHWTWSRNQGTTFPAGTPIPVWIEEEDTKQLITQLFTSLLLWWVLFRRTSERRNLTSFGGQSDSLGKWNKVLLYIFSKPDVKVAGSFQCACGLEKKKKNLFIITCNRNVKIMSLNFWVLFFIPLTLNFFLK